jgi:ABC-type bacteriocin/lantibiotic exporter with double-glycine peptidase domain
MLSGRVAQPLVGMARLVQEYEEVNAAIGEAGSVLNRPLEIDAASGGLRPKLAGAISFPDVTDEGKYPKRAVVKQGNWVLHNRQVMAALCHRVRSSW